jgi:regulator of nonsense transcripts 3
MSPSVFSEQIDGRFSGRYNWVVFRPGKNSQKHQSYARAYIDFKRPDDVIEFAEFFDGHVFVNEKGTQFKTIVEYAPSQRVPKLCTKKDGREGTIFKDPDYMEFLEFLAKPVENLPSADIQLERKEAERAGSAKDTPIVTPLMDFIRHKRAAKGGTRRSLSNGKLVRKVAGASSGNPSSTSSRRGSDKRRISNTMYVLRDAAKSTSGKAKLDEVSEERSGISGSTDTGKKKILLLKGKEKEIPHVSGVMSLQESATSVKRSHGSTPFKQNQRREASGRIIRSILLNKDARQRQSSSVVHSEQENQASNRDKDNRTPRAQIQLFLKDTNGAPENIGSDLRSFSGEKQEKHTRNRDRPDRGVWTPLRRSDGSHASDESLSSSASQSTQLQADSVKGNDEEVKVDILNARSGEVKTVGSGRDSYQPLNNGSHTRRGRLGIAHNMKDDGSFLVNEAKPLRRGGSSGYVPHEKQKWVQKSSAAS